MWACNSFPLPSPTIPCTINLYSFEIDRWTSHIYWTLYFLCFPIYHFRLTSSLEHLNSIFWNWNLLHFQMWITWVRILCNLIPILRQKKSNLSFKTKYCLWKTRRAPPSQLIININNPKINEKKNTHTHIKKDLYRVIFTLDVCVSCTQSLNTLENSKVDWKADELVFPELVFLKA